MFQKNSVTQRICCNAYVCISNIQHKIKHLYICNIVLNELNTEQPNRKNYSI